MTKIKLAAVLIAVVLMTILVIQNTEPVETNILFFTVTLPRALLLVLAFAIGTIVGLLIAFSLSSKKKTGDGR